MRSSIPVSPHPVTSQLCGFRPHTTLCNPKACVRSPRPKAQGLSLAPALRYESVGASKRRQGDASAKVSKEQMLLSLVCYIYRRPSSLAPYGMSFPASRPQVWGWHPADSAQAPEARGSGAGRLPGPWNPAAQPGVPGEPRVQAVSLGDREEDRRVVSWQGTDGPGRGIGSVPSEALAPACSGSGIEAVMTDRILRGPT